MIQRTTMPKTLESDWEDFIAEFLDEAGDPSDPEVMETTEVGHAGFSAGAGGVHDRLLEGATLQKLKQELKAFWVACVAEALLRCDELDWRQVEALVAPRRWPGHWQRPTVEMRREQHRELITLLRLGRKR
jgi:hypothetical protein